MEFPHIGANCGDKSCNMLDFLPMKCDACSQVFCRDHIHYATHNCPESYKKDNQVPICPLCNAAIPLKKGESPDVVVGSHIDNDCQSDPARQRRKIYTNKCAVKGCKQKELIPVTCDRCQKNFCLKHRHEQDHKCYGTHNSGQAVSKAGASGTRTSTGPFIVNSSQHSKQPEKKTNRSSQNTRMAASSLQGHMSEDEALAKALQLSLEDNPQAATPANKKMTQQEEEDFQLAQAIAASQAENSRVHNAQNTGSSQSRDQKSCSIS